MSLQSLLEDFGAPPPPAREAPVEAPPPAPAGPALAEEERLAAFEKGYSEGYEDAAAAATEERRRVGEALSERLGEIAVTAEEARAAVLAEVRELVSAIGDGVLPAMGREGFGAALAEAVAGEVETRGPCPVTVSVAPEAVDLVEPLMPEIEGFPITLRGDPDLGEGQAVIGLPDGEREVDTAALVERALAALREWVADARWGAAAAAASEDAPPKDEQEAAHG
jgi:flagellar assembly protein FliH